MVYPDEIRIPRATLRATTDELRRENTDLRQEVRELRSEISEIRSENADFRIRMERFMRDMYRSPTFPSSSARAASEPDEDETLAPDDDTP